MASKRLENILQFRVSLDDIEPRIWRRIQMPESFTLKQLHRVIQIVMGWQDGHLHEFSLSDKRYGDPNQEDEESVIDECTVRLRDLPLSIGGYIGYAYDFGDDWQHQLVLVVLEKTLVPNPESIYPACIAGERSAPPEDVGGAGGYAEFPEAIADPDHEEHDATLEWVGGHFDPEAFSVTEVNERLRRGLRAARKR
jgi:Plasmid pRiA4b ORF-3-like protein